MRVVNANKREQITYSAKKASSCNRNSSFDAPSKPLFKMLCIIPATHQYNLALITQSKSSIRNSNTILNEISGLAKTSRNYSTRSADPWDVPLIRTNMGKEILKYKLPSVLTEFLNKEADIFSLDKKSTRKILLEFL